ncbi:MAG: RelA/SpoT family protein, partial [Acutalibacteraceae bacterium]
MAFTEYTFSDIESAVKKSEKNYKLDVLKRAYDFGEKAHAGQFRKSGERYFSHPTACAIILINLGMDTETIEAALLHDVVEDTPVTLEELKSEFGEDIASLVNAVTKLGKIPYVTREEAQAENIRKMLIAMADDIRVIIIKLADRLHNMRTLSVRSEQKRRDVSRETLEIYAPIAHRLGIRPIKEELEDLAIRYLDPIAYEEIERLLSASEQYRDSLIKSIITRIENRLGTAVSSLHIEGRVKSIHGIYRKMYMQNKTFEEIYDVYAVRIITDTVANCYNILGFIHDMFRPIPGRFKDYISTPKPNMYQSLHTTVIGREGIPFEVQIRTWDMHRTAEFGIAAHWKYKEGISKSDERLESRLAWIRRIIDTQQESDDVEEIVTSIKTDLTQDDVFTVTPKGDVIALPAGSCVIDFAYAIHSAVGNKMIGAKVDGRIVPFDYKLKTGEIVDILTSAQPHGPSRDWLKIVRTSEARNKIRSWFKKERRAENIEQGKAEIEREFRRNIISVTDEEYKEILQSIAQRQHYGSIDDLYAAVGYGGLALSKFMPKIKERFKRSRQEKTVNIDDYITSGDKSLKEGITVDGTDNCLIKLSKCCSPLPGDAVIGFITRGHGVSVHKRDCSNVPKNLALCPDADRWIPVRWTGKANEKFDAVVRVYGINRANMLADVTVLLSNMHIGIHAVNAKELRDGNCEI